MNRRYETSYGVIPLRRHTGRWEVLLVQLHAGHWGFPKGHPEVSELPKDCAERELKEETGLDVSRYIDPHPLRENYFFYINSLLVSKTVYYYLAEVSGQLLLQDEEIQDSKWVLMDDAVNHVNFKESKRLCGLVLERLSYE